MESESLGSRLEKMRKGELTLAQQQAKEEEEQREEARGGGGDDGADAAGIHHLKYKAGEEGLSVDTIFYALKGPPVRAIFKHQQVHAFVRKYDTFSVDGTLQFSEFVRAVQGTHELDDLHVDIYEKETGRKVTLKTDADIRQWRQSMRAPGQAAAKKFAASEKHPSFPVRHVK